MAKEHTSPTPTTTSSSTNNASDHHGSSAQPNQDKINSTTSSPNNMSNNTTTTTTRSSLTSTLQQQQNNSIMMVQSSDKSIILNTDSQFSHHPLHTDDQSLKYISCVIASVLLLFMIIYIPSYYRLDIIFIILPILTLTLPIIFYEIYRKLKSMYLEHVHEHYSSLSIIYLFLFTFTCVVMISSLLFFTFETLEHSYYDQREEFNTNTVLIQDLQNEILMSCSSVSVNCCENEIISYITDHIQSINGMGKSIDTKTHLGKKFVIEQVLSVLRRHKGFERFQKLFNSTVTSSTSLNSSNQNSKGNSQNNSHNDDTTMNRDDSSNHQVMITMTVDGNIHPTQDHHHHVAKGYNDDTKPTTTMKTTTTSTLSPDPSSLPTVNIQSTARTPVYCYKYKYTNFKPMNIQKYIKSYDWHDRVQTFFKRVSKGFGLTHD
ncbi:hypothetical protein C9374_012572 [Naegleria lovaniensis]|uniref:Transmembrane protein n=1 Tax=Naegleria lovaniensis TaxID=51637 RepID=A0AA88KW49_NAELO|nr:uncharacterized protein C9374_012572 [Naegleria lovaniensis]KAG2392320.1 hypothetical protein C9374_012572 [Naegleria lovaniensis]